MKEIFHDLPGELTAIEIHTFADEHIGDALSDLKRLKARIDYVANTPNAYCILNGDIIDYASRSSIGDIETRNLNIMDQVDAAVRLFYPIKDKVLCITPGNHEGRAYKKEGIDITRIIATQLGLGDLYSRTSVYMFVRFGKVSKKKNRSSGKQQYSFYVLHGTGGGRKEGSKAARLADMAGICDADIYIHSHTHLPMVFKEAFYRVDSRNHKVKKVFKLFVNTASNLGYGGYGEDQEYKPGATDYPVICLSGTRRDMKGIL